MVKLLSDLSQAHRRILWQQQQAGGQPLTTFSRGPFPPSKIFPGSHEELFFCFYNNAADNHLLHFTTLVQDPNIYIISSE